MATKLDEDHDSLHGETAARRQAITELLFFASVGDLYRCRKITTAWGLQASVSALCANLFVEDVGEMLTVRFHRFS